MKTKDQITLNEVMNDGKTVHLYYNEMVGCFTAYGYSAFYATHVVEPLCAFSKELQMPVVVLTPSEMKELVLSMKRVAHEDGYYQFEAKAFLGAAGYEKWVENVKKKEGVGCLR